jgi:alkylhydroperoxidase family enzyme
MSSRVPMLSLEQAREAAEQVGLLPAFAELNIFRVLLRQPVLAKGVADMLVALLLRGKLDARLRELVIMRLGWATGSEYEWTQHWRVALELGVSEEDLLALRDWPASDRFGPAERAVLTATDEVLESGQVSAQTFAECRSRVGGDEEILELVSAIAWWRMVSTLLRSCEIPLEEGTPGWPPDGARPPASPVA